MAEPLRLLLWHWGRRGGGPRYTLELARALAERPDLDLHLSLSRQSELFTETAALGLPSWHVDTYRDLPSFILATARLPAVRRGFLRYLAEQRIDVVYNTLDFLWGAFLGPAISRAGALYLLAVHDAERHSGEDGPVRRWLLRRDISAADAAVTMTDAVREQLVAIHRFPADRVFTAPHGVFLDPSAAKPRDLPSGRPVRLLFFGRVLPYKGLDMLLEALSLIRAVRPDVELEIWGSGDLAPHRDALNRTPGVRIENRWLGEQEIPGIFAATDVCVLPYREASQSGVIATAVASGMPVVTTAIPGLVEQIGRGRAGRIASEISAKAFAAAVIELLADPSEYKRVSEQALALGRSELAWPSIADRIVAAARTTIDLGRRPT